MPLLSETSSNKRLNRELKEIAGLNFAEDRFDNMPFSFNDYPAFKAHLSVLLAAEGCYLNQPPKKGDKGYRNWDTSIGFNAFDLQRHTASVDEHTDDVSKSRYFGMFVIETKQPTRSSLRGYYDTRSELRYFDPQGYKKRSRLSKGDLVMFNPRKNHELIYYGDLTTVALFDIKRLKK